MGGYELKFCCKALQKSKCMWVSFFCKSFVTPTLFRGRSKATATSKMECFVIIVNGWKQLSIITKRSILDVAVVLDPPTFLKICSFQWSIMLFIVDIIYIAGVWIDFVWSNSDIFQCTDNLKEMYVRIHREDFT